MDREQAIKLMQDLLRRMVDRKGSDLFITSGFPPAIKIDGEVRRIVQENYTRAEDLLTNHKEALLKIADELLTREVLDGAQVKAIAQGEALAAAPANAHATAVVDAATPQAAAQEGEKPAGGVSPPLPDPLPQQH